MEETYTVGHAIDSLGFGWFQIGLSVVVGLCMIADAMEMMILSILSPALHCHWHISQVQQAALTTIVFLGMMSSSPFWGIMADKYGRKIAVICSSAFLFYFGFLTSFSPSFAWIICLRFLVGVFIGGVPQACVLYAEYMPSKIRGKAIIMLAFFWAVGSSFEALLALAVMPNGGQEGWRWLVAYSSIPMAILLLLAQFLPESPMYLAAAGKRDAVERQLNKVAQWNRKPSLLGYLVLENEGKEQSRGKITDLLKGDQCKLTLMVWFLWFVGAFTYYGTVLLSTELLNSNDDICSAYSDIDGLPGRKVECSVRQCQGLTENDYVSLIWTTFAEFPGAIFALVLVDVIGRRKILALQAFMFAISTFCVIECSLSKNFLIVLLFLSRGLSSGFLQTVYVYTPEVYSTKMRAVALGSGSAAARIGAMITPYVAQVLLRQNLYTAVIVYAAFGLAAAVTSWFLPIETMGVDLTYQKPEKEEEEETRITRPNNKGRTKLVNEVITHENEEEPPRATRY